MIQRHLTPPSLSLVCVTVPFLPDWDLRGLLPGLHAGLRLVGDGALPGAAVRGIGGAGEAVRGGAGGGGGAGERGVFRLAGTAPRLHLESGENTQQYLISRSQP